MTATELMERFYECHPSFREHIANLGNKYRLNITEVYGCWREYCRDCSNFDQSPVLFEFENWYKDRFAKMAAECEVTP